MKLQVQAWFMRKPLFAKFAGRFWAALLALVMLAGIIYLCKVK